MVKINNFHNSNPSLIHILTTLSFLIVLLSYSKSLISPLSNPIYRIFLSISKQFIEHLVE